MRREVVIIIVLAVLALAVMVYSGIRESAVDLAPSGGNQIEGMLPKLLPAFYGGGSGSIPGEGKPCETDEDCAVDGVVCLLECKRKSLFNSQKICKPTGKKVCRTGECVDEGNDQDDNCPCPSGTSECCAGGLSGCKNRICCEEGFSCTNIDDNPKCYPLSAQSCDEGEVYCPGSSPEKGTCCDGERLVGCETYFGWAVCKQQENGNCPTGETTCGDFFCCRGNEECTGGLFPLCSATSCPDPDEELCGSEDTEFNICCPTGTCWIDGDIPSCLPISVLEDDEDCHEGNGFECDEEEIVY